VPNFQPIQNDRHAKLRWKRTASFSFAAGEALAPITLDEVPRAALAMPLAFVADADDAGAYQLVAVQGVQPGRNLCVGADGVWQADYLPAAYRSLPFRLGRVDDGKRVVLCIDEDMGLAADGEPGEPFFGADGKPGSELSQVWDFLNRLARDREATREACAVLTRLGLIQSWALKFQDGEREQAVNGLFRIDHAAFEALPAEALAELRQAGALPLVYLQPMSAQNFGRLARYARQGAAARTNGSTPPDAQ